MAREDSSAVLQPGLGLYLGQPPLYTPKRALRDCLNIRIKNQTIVRDNVGYGPFPDTAVTPLNLDNLPVTLIDNFFPNAGGQFLIFGNTRDLFEFIEASGTVLYLTPRYETGTVAVTNGSAVVTGTSTLWAANLKAMDRITVGATGVRDPAATWYEIASVDSDTQVTLTTPYAGTTQTGQAYTARKVFTGDTEDYWEAVTFYGAAAVTQGSPGDRWYATNGTDRVVAWDGLMDQVYLLTDLDSCWSLAVHKNILIYINITYGGANRSTAVRTSAIGEPENVSTKEAAEFVVHDGSDALQAGYTLGENLVLYGERSITLAQFIGEPLVFVFRNVIDGLGPRSGRAVADFGDYHSFIGPDTLYVFDGVSLTEADGHIWREVIRQSSPARLNLINSVFDEENGELVWVIPLNTDAGLQPNDPPEIAFVEHYLEDPGDEGAPGIYTKRQLPATAFGYFARVDTLTFDQITSAWSDQNYRWNDQFFQAAFPYTLFGDATGNVYIMNTKDTANGTVLRSFARFGRRALGSIEGKGVIRRLYPMVEPLPAANYSLAVKFYTTDVPGGTAVLERTEMFPLAPDGDRHFVSPRLAARYVEVEFETIGAGHIWTSIGYDMDVVPGGSR